ncbi:Uncharacterised protein [Chlamydia trachomatis]|nr:Uncharacterised protein [Chlamydia trachomatis]
MSQLFLGQDSGSLLETVARRRSAALLSGFGLGHVREYALPSVSSFCVCLVPYIHLAVSALQLILHTTFSINDLPSWEVRRILAPLSRRGTSPERLGDPDAVPSSLTTPCGSDKSIT